MSRRPKNSQTVALFPFLAVLVCTMGSLIFLLLVTTRMIRERTTAPAASTASSTQSLPLLVTPESVSPTEPSAPAASVAPPVVLEPGPPAESPVALAAVSREQRQRELDALIATWQDRVESLNETRDARQQQLTQRQQLQKVAAQRVESLQQELTDAEVRLGKLTGELSAFAVQKGSAQELIDLETQIRELKRRLRAAQQVQPADCQFEVVPFDPISGTSRRPILIECTSTGLKFVPEDVPVRPNDLVGFSPRVNPLVIGASALVNYWTAWNMRQANPAREPEPYVLLVVRPSGTVAYYVAMKMLSELRQPHGYELIDEDTVLNLPPVDAGAKAACETAINRLIAERNNTLRQAGLSPGGAFRRGSTGNGGGGSGTAPGGTASGAGSGTGSGRPGGEEFDLADVMNTDPAAGQSWERIENFEGGRRGPPTGGAPPARPAGAQSGTPGASGKSGSLAVTAGGQAVAPASGPPGSVPQLDAAGTTDQLPSDLPAPEEAGPGIGLGSSGSSSIPVEDRRSRKSRTSAGPLRPEDLAHRPWGLSEPGAAIGLEREVRIDVEPERYVIGKKQVIRIEDSETAEDSFARIVGVLDQQARDWGKPPKGFFWKPSLQYVIADGADANYERVHTLLERAGLSSTRTFASVEGTPAVETPAPEVPPSSGLTPAPATAKPPARRLLRGILR